MVFNGCAEDKKDYTQFVNVFIGTEGDGNTFPGATMPFGAVQLSPDTGLEGAAKFGSYKYDHNSIIGFSHTHLNGVGEPEYRDVLMMPTVGEVILKPGDENDTKTGYRSKFDHKNEIAGPGYYSVLLDDYDVKVELTSTLRAGFHKYTFPKAYDSHIILDLAFPGGDAEDLILKKVSDTEIEGMRRSHGWAYDQYVYFVAQFSKPFGSFEIAVDDNFKEGLLEARDQNLKAVINYQTKEGEEILVKVGISAVSTEGARKNLEAEIPDWNFDRIVNLAKDAWNQELAKIEIEGGTEDQKIFFYTSMYHAFMSPDIYMDVDGKYRGIDRKVHKAEGFTNYTVFSLWDTFRALHPLFTIIEQERTNDFIKSLLQKYEDGGRLPMWALAGNYTDDMLGYHAVPVIADAYIKGIRGYDVKKAYEAVKHSAELEKLGLKYYKKIGYLSYDIQAESVSKTLEYSYDDWCILQMANDLGSEDDIKRYDQRSQFYRNVFDSTSGFMRGKSVDREWLTPFDPLKNSAYSEGNAYQYMFVPQDTDGLIAAMGGDQKLSQWLDVLFSLDSEEVHEGSIGQYWQGNEPSHHLAYLYNFVGESWKTQKLVHQILTELHSATPRGLSGNDDCGQMSAWYILSAMGFYSVTPGQDIYVIGSPLFEKATINLENEERFIIVAKNVSDKNIYIQSASLNGNNYTKSYIKHQDIMNGGTLAFVMGDKPNKNWGTSIEDRPYSVMGSEMVALPYIRSGSTLFTKSTEIGLACSKEGAEIRYTLDGTEPDENSNLYKNPIKISETNTIKIRSFHKDLKPSITIDYEIKKATFKKAVQNVKVKRGLHYDYFERFFVTTEDMNGLEPLESGTMDTFTIENAKIDNYFGYQFEGYIKLPEDGIYNFYLESNDGSRLFIDDVELIENEANHGPVEEPGDIALKKGLHKIKVRYFQCGGGKMLKLSYSSNEIAKKEIPSSILFQIK
jgi:predicted alpha-1,2-mannosidase